MGLQWSFAEDLVYMGETVARGDPLMLPVAARGREHHHALKNCFKDNFLKKTPTPVQLVRREAVATHSSELLLSDGLILAFFCYCCCCNVLKSVAVSSVASVC